MIEKSKLNVETILAYIGVTHENVRQDAYNHWFRFIDFCKRNSGRKWKDDIRPKLRSWIGVDFRYIDDYFEACKAWNIIDLNDGTLFFRGLPSGADIPTELTDEQLREELKEENEQRNKLGKPKITLKKWKRIRQKRFKPLE